MTNAKIAATITNVPHAVDALKEMGWVESSDGLVLPNSICLAQDREIAAIIEAKQYYKAKIDGVSDDAFEYQGYSGEKTRLVMLRNDRKEIVDIEISVADEAFWTGRPVFYDATGNLTCGDKGSLAVPERERARLKSYLARCPKPELKPNVASSSSANSTVEGASEDTFDYKDFDGERIRLVMQRNDRKEIVNIEVLVDGKPFWTGRPVFSDDTGNLTCGDKGASAVPEGTRERLKAFLALWPQPVLKLNLE